MNLEFFLQTLAETNCRLHLWKLKGRFPVVRIQLEVAVATGIWREEIDCSDDCCLEEGVTRLLCQARQKQKESDLEVLEEDR